MAIENYSNEAAREAWERSFEKEISPEVRQAATNLIDAFALGKNEDLYVVTDGDVVRVFPEIIRAVQERGQEVMKEQGTGRLKLMVAEPAEHSAVSFEEHIGEYLTAPGHKAVLILTRMSRSWSPETQDAGSAIRGLNKSIERSGETFDEEKVKEFAKKRNARIISVTKAADRKVLTEGAILEPLPEIRRRSEAVARLMEGVTRVHVTSEAGTDVWIELRPEYSGIETGKVDKPGTLTNFPVGEFYVLPRQAGTHGRIVIHDSPMGGAIRRETMDGHAVELMVENGKLQSIKDLAGEGRAEQFKAYLEAGRNAKDPEHGDPFKIAEFAIGTNTKAWKDVDGQEKVASTSVEAEKAYRTIHIAFGANGVYGQPADDPELTKVQTHADSVVLKPTVECFRPDGSSFFVIKEGEPQGY